MKQNIMFAIVAVVILAGGWYLVKERPSAGNTNPINTNTNMDQLKIEDLVVGTGAEAKPGSVVTVQYTGTFDDGAKFDSSYDHGQPFSFLLGAGGVIQGWDQGIPGMKVGGKRRLTVPPNLGYGDRDYGSIPASSTLHFDVELLDVKASG